MPLRPASRGWFWGAVALTALKLWLTSGQTLFAIGPALHDDRLFVEQAAHLIDGHWLGPYNQFTLAKGPMFPLFIATAFWLGLPLMFAQQLLYAGACATLVRSLRPWLRSGAAWLATYAVLLWNPMSFDAGTLSRVMRQNLYTPLALFCVAGLVLLFARRHESWRRQAGPAALAGLSLGCFWLTREEGVWILPAIGLLALAPVLVAGREFAARWRQSALALGIVAAGAALPVVLVCAQNYRHYGWFGTVEFRAAEFKDAYGALTRLQTGARLPQVPVTRAMRERAYELSPTFRKLQPHLEGPVGDHWSDKERFPAADRQMRGGWFVWALRDAFAAAGLAPDARTALRNYRLVADELNAVCDAGRVAALPRRSGFAPVLDRASLPALFDTGLEFGWFFLSFGKFSAYSPDSVGDYAELKPFRNVVGSRLSHAPRSPEPSTPEQDRSRDWKVKKLDRIATAFAFVFSWLGPLLLLVGVARLAESAAARHVTFALGFAGALLLACGAYVAINVLIQVTSFDNMHPAALHSAYPLYLAALAMIAADAVHAWRHPRLAGRAPVLVPARPAWIAATGAALVVFAARLAEIHFHGGDVPYNDQWIIEAEQIIGPWIDGTLSLRDFFIPHFEHLPVWTRLLTWLQVALTGRWDPLVQMTFNAALYAGFIWLAARWVWRTVGPGAALALGGLLVLTGGLPHAWENIAWGFQSQFPLALLLLFIHVTGSCTEPAGSRRWWLAQAAAVAALFTLASLWLAPLAVVLSWLWTGPRRKADLLAPAVIAAAGAGMLLLIHRQSGTTFTQGPRAVIDFVQSALHLLGWPSLIPGAVALLQLPWLVHALRLRQQPAIAPVDRVTFVLGLLNLLQATALAFGRTGDNDDFVSRYGDLLAPGVVAGALALARLMPDAGRARSAFFVLAAAWSGLVVAGLVQNSTAGHAHYFHLYAAEHNALRRDAVREYLATGQGTKLASPVIRPIIGQDAARITPLLDRPAFRALLPASVEPRNPPDAAGRLARALQNRWAGLLVAGGLVLVGGGAWQAWRSRGCTPAGLMGIASDPWQWRVPALIGSLALLATLVWSNPPSFDAAHRWQRWLGGDRAVSGLTWVFGTPAAFGPERLQGAAPLRPEVLRNQFFGTAPAGPGFTGTVLSSRFLLEKPWLIVPYAGYPVGNGNGLRLRFLDERGNQAGDELGCPGPNSEAIAYWTIDVRAYRGHRVQVVLYDGRTDTEAWVAAAPPVPADAPELAATLQEGLANEQYASVHLALAAVALAGLAGAFLTWRSQRG